MAGLGSDPILGDVLDKWGCDDAMIKQDKTRNLEKVLEILGEGWA